MRQIYGMMMRPCAVDAEDYEKIWKSSDFYTDKDFYGEYQKHLIAQQHIVACAKMYIEKNWQKITDWTGLDVKIRDNSKTVTEYFNYKERPKRKKEKEEDRKGKARVYDPPKNSTFRKIIDEMDREDKEKHNPIVTVENVVLDHSDGDFSLIVNGKKHLWIDEESVIIIADFIENKLNGK